MPIWWDEEGHSHWGWTDTTQSDANSASITEYGRMLLALSEGKIGGLVNGLKSVFLDGTPVQNGDSTFNFEHVSVGHVLGTNTQAMIPGFSDIESETDVSTQLKYGSSVTKTYSTSGISALRIKIGVPLLWWMPDATTGQKIATSVSLKVERQSPNYTPSGGAAGDWETVDLDAGTGVTDASITGRYGARFTKGWRIELPADGPWSIRITRSTADSESDYLQNDTWWDTTTEITDAKLRYPNTALLGLLVNAEQFPTLPEVHSECYGILCQVPANYDTTARTYATSGTGTSNGAWDGTFKTAWTNNPAWLFYELATNARFGAGAHLDASKVDKWALYEIAQHCDEMVSDGKGGTEPRFQAAIYLQAQDDAIAVLRNLAGVFRSMLYVTGNVIVPVQDVAGEPVALFTQANVKDGFTYSGTARAARHTAAMVSWINPAAGYTKAIEYVEDASAIARYGLNVIEIEAIGAFTQAQAQRLGKWTLATEQLETETVSFKPGLDASTVYPGALVQIQDNQRAGSARMAGRVLEGATATVIPLDATVTMASGKTYELKCRLSTGEVESRTVTTASGTASTLTVGTAFSGAPPYMGMWILHESDVQNLYRVLSVTEDDALNRTVTALLHDPNKYAIADDTSLTDADWSTRTPVTKPTGLTLGTGYSIGNAGLQTSLTASWTAVTGAKGYAAFCSQDYGVWRPMSVSGASARMDGVTSGRFRVRVFAVGGNGRRSIPAESTLEVVAAASGVPYWPTSGVPPAPLMAFANTLLLDQSTVILPAVTDLGGESWASYSTLYTPYAKRLADLTAFLACQWPMGYYTEIGVTWLKLQYVQLTGYSFFTDPARAEDYSGLGSVEAIYYAVTRELLAERDAVLDALISAKEA